MFNCHFWGGNLEAIDKESKIHYLVHYLHNTHLKEDFRRSDRISAEKHQQWSCLPSHNARDFLRFLYVNSFSLFLVVYAFFSVQLFFPQMK